MITVVLLTFFGAISYKEIRTYRSHLQYSLSRLLIKQPPLRTSYYSTAEFHRKGGYDDKSNYILLKTTAGKNELFYMEEKIRSVILRNQR